MSKSNSHETVMGNVTLLTSYTTNVACHIAGEGFYKVGNYYSVTTTRHVNDFIRKHGGNVDCAVKLSRDEFDKLVARAI